MRKDTCFILPLQLYTTHHSPVLRSGPIDHPHQQDHNDHHYHQTGSTLPFKLSKCYPLYSQNYQVDKGDHDHQLTRSWGMITLTVF